jgi:predicted RNA-binding Zn-ribbon protein involved in translation (DUF1610 family)
MAPPNVVTAVLDESAHMGSGWLKIETEHSVPRAVNVGEGPDGKNVYEHCYDVSTQTFVFCETCAPVVMGDLFRKSKERCPKCSDDTELRQVTPSFIDPEDMTLKRMVKCPEHGNVVVWRSE